MENCAGNRSEAIVLGLKRELPDWRKKPTDSTNPIPYYANRTVDLYYPTKPENTEETTIECPLVQNPDILNRIVNYDWSRQLNTIDVRKHETLSKIQHLDSKLNSKHYSFLGRFQPDVSCSCSHSDLSSCPCPQRKLPMKFDLTNNCNKDSGLKCIRDCPLPMCKCGPNCPALPGPLETLPKRTFHVPGCPMDSSLIPVPKSSIPGLKVCPFYPACCPIGDTCPFPVDAIYDSEAPAIMDSNLSRRCRRKPTQSVASGKLSKYCPLSPACGGGSTQSLLNILTETNKRNCPLLSCTLGPMLADIFDDEECPFCYEKSCPLVSSDVGCIGAQFCPQSNFAICALRNLPEAMKSQESKEEIQLKAVNETGQSGECFSYNEPKVCTFSRSPCSSSQPTAVRETTQLQSETREKPARRTVEPNVEREHILFDCPFLRPVGRRSFANDTNERKTINDESNGEKSTKKPFFPDEPNSVISGVRNGDNIISSKRRSGEESPSPKREFKSNSTAKSSSAEDHKRPPLANTKLLQQAYGFSDTEHMDETLATCCKSAQRKDNRISNNSSKTQELAFKGPVISPKANCPIKTAPCEMFPKGRCPMEDTNLCECEYPLTPCMERLIPEHDSIAEPQYCYRMDCCMGLPLPPTKHSEEFETDTWYKFSDVKPGQSVTKHYLEPLTYPPEPEFLISVNEKRAYPSWKIIKYGEAYRKCKRIKAIIDARGSMSTLGTQFDLEDLPSDEEIAFIKKCRKEGNKQLEGFERKMLESQWVS